MSSLQHRITSFTQLSANLIAQLSEVDSLRKRVRKAQLAARKSRPYIKGKRPRLPCGVELGRD